MFDDTIVGSRWRGRPERDYVPPGGMRNTEDEVLVGSGSSTAPQDAGPVAPVSSPTEGRPVTKARRANSTPKQRAPYNRGYVSASVAPRLTCNDCGSPKLKCMDSRPAREGRLRRYKCLKCGGLVHTIEQKVETGK
jgi:hypothetical protein